MSKLQIILVVMVAVVLAIVISTYTSSTSNTTFEDAKEKVNEKVKIVGTLDKSFAIQHDPMKDANLTVFKVIDKDNFSQVVYLHSEEGSPQGLANSESVTLEGKMNESGEFHADHIQLKCPSKYNEEQHSVQ
jgi:cytochrome c-type biogenesis protein CcmE